MNKDELKHFLVELFQRMLKILLEKNHDYTSDSDNALANFDAARDFGVDTNRGLAVRLGDKFGRLKTYFKGGSLLVQGEGVEDTLLDIIGYAALLLASIHRDKNKNKKVI